MKKIETSYRQLGEACIRTSTRNPTLRFLFVGIALAVFAQPLEKVKTDKVQLIYCL